MIASLYYKLFLVLGLVVSFEDWNEKRVRNHWIVLGLIACAAGLAYLMWNSFVGYRHLAAWGGGYYYLPWRYYPKVLAHLVLCVTAAFTLWRLNVWPAGDAKLYIVFGLFAAIIDPNIPGFPLLLFMVMLVNVFVPAGILFAVETILRVLPGLRAAASIEWGKWFKAVGEAAWVRVKDAWPFRYRYMTLTVNLLALFFGMIVVGSLFRRLSLGPFGQLLVFLAILVVWAKAMALLQNHTIGVVALICLATVLVAGTVARHWFVWAWLVSAIKMTLNFGLFISFARILFDWFIEWDSRLDLDPDSLKPGVILSDESWARLKSVPELAGKLGERYSDGLSAEEAEVLKAWLAQRGAGAGGKDGAPAQAGDGAPVQAGETYKVYRTIPFAVWIFMGTLLTLYYRGSVLVLLTPYYGRVKAVLKVALSGWFS